MFLKINYILILVLVYYCSQSWEILEANIGPAVKRVVYLTGPVYMRLFYKYLLYRVIISLVNWRS